MKLLKQPVSRIASLREQAKLTQLELAQLLGVTENTIANWEKGRSSLDWIERVIKLCKIFQCTPDQLIEYVPVTEPVEAKTKRLEELRRLIDTHEPVPTDKKPGPIPRGIAEKRDDLERSSEPPVPISSQESATPSSQVEMER